MGVHDRKRTDGAHVGRLDELDVMQAREMSCGPAALVVDENAHEERRRRPHPRQVLVAASNHQVATRRACGNAARDTLMASVVRRRRVARSMLGQCVRHVTQAVCRAPRDVATPQQRSLASEPPASATILCLRRVTNHVCDSRVTVTNRFCKSHIHELRPQLCIPDASLLLQLRGPTARLRRRFAWRYMEFPEPLIMNTSIKKTSDGGIWKLL
jgi:hypothetical protein